MQLNYSNVNVPMYLLYACTKLGYPLRMITLFMEWNGIPTHNSVTAFLMNFPCTAALRAPIPPDITIHRHRYSNIKNDWYANPVYGVYINRVQIWDALPPTDTPVVCSVTHSPLYDGCAPAQGIKGSYSRCFSMMWMIVQL